MHYVPDYRGSGRAIVLLEPLIDAGAIAKFRSPCLSWQKICGTIVELDHLTL